MVDLGKVKSGDTVVFNTGNSRVVDRIYPRVKEAIDNQFFVLSFAVKEDYNTEVDFHRSGYAVGLAGIVFITEIIPAQPFNWGDVKRGMAFKRQTCKDTVYHYIGWSLNNGDYGIFQVVGKSSAQNPIRSVSVNMMKRCPEHDMKIGK